jgi:hypothetical protein
LARVPSVMEGLSMGIVMVLVGMVCFVG